MSHPIAPVATITRGGMDEQGLIQLQAGEFVETLWTRSGGMRVPRSFAVYDKAIRKSLDDYLSQYLASRGDQVVQAATLRPVQRSVMSIQTIAVRYQMHMDKLHALYGRGCKSICVN